VPIRPNLALLVAFSTLAYSAIAYEGAGILREEEPAPAPKAPVLTKAPSVLTAAEAVYPADLLAQRKAGEVKLVIDIDAEGKVPAATVTGTSGEAAFDESAREAMLRYVFSPAELDGKPAAVQIEFVYRFVPPEPVLREPDAPPPPPPVNLKGRILQRGTRDPIAGASVFIPGTDLVAETDEKGLFELRGVASGTVALEVTAAKHRRFKTAVEVRDGEATELTAYVWREVENGFEATVRAERDKKEVVRRTLQKEELLTVPGTFGDPVRVIQNLPGMARAPFTSGALLVRGAQPQDTSVLIDQVPIPILYHFGGGPSVVNPSFIDRIDFFPGAFGAKYGRATAGVVDVGTKPPEPKRLHGSFDIDLLKAGFYLEGPIHESKDLGTWALAARRSYFDAFVPSLLEATRSPGDAAFVVLPRYWDYQSRYDLKRGKNRWEFVVFGSDDVLTVAQGGTTETQGFSVNNHQGFHRARIKWTRNLGEGLTFSLAPTMGTTIVDLDINKLIKLNIFSYDFNTRAALTKVFSDRLTVEGGFELNTNLYRLDFQLPKAPEFFAFPGESPDLGTDARKYGVNVPTQGLFVEGSWKVTDRLKLVPGLRLELYNIPKGQVPSVEPRLAGRFDLDDMTVLKAAWGLYRRGPNPQLLDPDVGNPYLGLPKSSQWNAGIERRLAAKLSLDLQGFFNWRTSLETVSSKVVERDGKQQVANYDNSGFGRAYGLEVLLKQDLTERAYGWLAYTLSRSEQWDETSKKYLPVIFDQKHIVSIVSSYKWNGGWETGARFRLTTGRPTTNINGSVYDTDTSTYTCLRSIPGSARTPTFHQLDVRAEKLFTYETWKLSGFLDIQNVYNAANPEATLADYRCNQTAPLRGLPFLPTLGMTGSF
jgi:TonB family protein